MVTALCVHSHICTLNSQDYGGDPLRISLATPGQSRWRLTPALRSADRSCMDAPVTTLLPAGACIVTSAAIGVDPREEVRAIPAALPPIKVNPLVRRRLVPLAVDIAAVHEPADSDLASSETVVAAIESPGCDQDTSAAADCGVSGARLKHQHVESGEQQSAQSRGSRRAAAARKQKTSDPDMLSLKEGLAGSDRDAWLRAMQEEVDALGEHGTFGLCYLPAGKRAFSGKRVLKIKRGPAGEIQRYKARYVARGFSQVEGIDFFETWSPVGSYAALRVLLAIAAQWT